MQQSKWDHECHQLASWWLQYAVDEVRGGFFGEVSFDNEANINADKCIILNTRILWFFSAAAAHYSDKQYMAAAHRAYQYLKDYFHDKDNQGFYWSLKCNGELLDSRKHIYAQAFAIYALSAYFEASGEREALDLALQCFDKIEAHGRDPKAGGYFESFNAHWQKNEDARLSAKEDNHPKTMNTHLHVLEAYTGLCKTLKSCGAQAQALVEQALVHVLEVYCQRIVDVDVGCIKMFLTEDWQDCSHEYSFGHDIESSWLLVKALKVLAKPELSEAYLPYAQALAERSFLHGLLDTGRMLDEVSKAGDHESNTAWWVQVEAMVGFAYMWQLNGDPKYQQAVERIWAYTVKEYRDAEFGEWHWYAKSDLPFRESEYKIGAWKAPYHTGRAFMELSKYMI